MSPLWCLEFGGGCEFRKICGSLNEAYFSKHKLLSLHVEVLCVCVCVFVFAFIFVHLMYLTVSLYHFVIPYPTAFPYGNGMVLHFYQQQESSTTKTVHKVINKGLKAYV